MCEFGLFSDEGIIEGGFSSKEEAEEAIKKRYSEEDELKIFECCPEHPDFSRICCEECDAEEEQEEIDEAEDDDAI